MVKFALSVTAAALFFLRALSARRRLTDLGGLAEHALIRLGIQRPVRFDAPAPWLDPEKQSVPDDTDLPFKCEIPRL